jgi:hypothetical protein
VGSCGLYNASDDLWLVDSLAFVASLPTEILNIKDPSHPVEVGSMGEAEGICVKDTFAYLAHFGQGLDIWSVAKPKAPYLIATCSLPSQALCVAINRNIAYVGEAGKLRVFDISRPTVPAQVGYYQMPDDVCRVRCSGPYVYAACFDAGVCIMETTGTTGVVEKPSSGEKANGGHLRVEAAPNPVRDGILLQIDSPEARGVVVSLIDASGRRIIEVRCPIVAGRARLVLPGDRMPPGVYFVTAKSDISETTTKVVKE